MLKTFKSDLQTSGRVKDYIKSDSIGILVTFTDPFSAYLFWFL